MDSTPAQRRSVPQRYLVIIVMLGAIALFSVPTYLSGAIPWRTPAEVANVAPLRALRDQGLTVPNWETQEQRTLPVGNHQWSMQALLPPADAVGIQTNKPTFLMLRSQDWHDKEPQVEWVDLDGFWGRLSMGTQAEPEWRTDRRQRVQFTVTVPDPQDATVTHTVPITAQYQRARNQNQTFAMLQWYTWPTGGTPSATDWFWADQRSRLRTGDRAAWVAVSLIVPVDPLVDLSQPEMAATLIDLGKTVEIQLLTTAILPAMISPPA